MQCLFTYSNSIKHSFDDDSCQRTSAYGERERLDDLLGLALVDPDICERLIVQRDPSLFEEFNLSDEARQSFANGQVSTLQEFAQAIVAAAIPHYSSVQAAA